VPPAMKRYRDALIVGVLLAFPFFVLKANMKSPEEQSALDEALLRFSTPFESAAATLARGVTGVLSDYFYLVDVKRDNERLAYENARLRERERALEQAQADNRQLRRLLQLKDSTEPDAETARVIGKDYTEFFRVTRIVLDQGTREIKPHSPVISPDGVVGAVLHASAETAEVELAVDAAFGVDVEDERTHARGFVRGTGDPARYGCRVEMVDSRDEVDIGDLLVTSGKGRWFPRGIPVARVTRVVKRELGRDQDVDALPTVDFSRLDSVLVLSPVGDETPSANVPTGPTGPRGRP
jgi:rod shape-determining protein MreC